MALLNQSMNSKIRPHPSPLPTGEGTRFLALFSLGRRAGDVARFPQGGQFISPFSTADFITDARTQIELAIEDSPSLRSYFAEQLEAIYQRARHHAAKQTSMAIAVFPEACPYSPALVLAEDWLPQS